MTLHSPKIQLEALSEKQLEVYNDLDSKTYGSDLATQVATKLVTDRGLFHSHKYYCGIGLFFYENVFTMGDVHDGYEAPFEIVATFEDKDDFIAWLANENYQSMSLYGEFNNQTITKIRLEWFLEDDYSPVWNNYCDYVRKKNNL